MVIKDDREKASSLYLRGRERYIYWAVNKRMLIERMLLNNPNFISQFVKGKY